MSANDQHYEQPFQYRCSTGRHVIGSDTPVTKCPAYHHGSPCPGTLTRFGPGSQGPRKQET